MLHKEFTAANYFENRAGGLEGLQYRDKIKKKFCIENNISYIEISYKEFNNINKILKKII